MNVLIGVHHFPPRYTGGAEWRAHRTALALQARGHRVRVVCIESITAHTEGLTWRDEVYDGIDVRRLSFDLSHAPDPFVFEYDNAWIGEHMRVLMREFKPNVFHLISGYLMTGRPALVAHELGIPTALTLTDFWFICRRVAMLRSDGHVSSLPLNPHTCAQCIAGEQRPFHFLNRTWPALMTRYWRGQHAAADQMSKRICFQRDVLNTIKTIISPSQFLRSMHIDFGVHPDQIVYSRQGHDFALAPARNETRPRKDSTPLRIGYLGQIAAIKGVHVSVEAIKLLKSSAVQLSIWGDPSREPRYVQEVRRMAHGDARITFAGAFTRANLASVMQSLDVVVVPSLWYENSPNVILEAFGHHVPVIASNFGGMAELVQHDQNGLTFEMGNAHDLARQLQRLIDEPELLATLRRGAAQTPPPTTAEEMDALTGIYDALIDKAAPPK